MSNVAIHKDKATAFPLLEEVAKRMDDVRKRAFELFERRGSRPGSELDDWFTAELEVFGRPRAEMKERNGDYEVEVSLPGFAPGDVEVSATPDTLVVHAASERRAKSEPDEKVIWSEFGSREVYRRFALPEEVDASKVSAKLENGLLKLRAPKAKVAPEAEAARKIPVTSG